MADPDIMALLERTMGFRPVPGTLNVMLDQPFVRGAGDRIHPGQPAEPRLGGGDRARRATG